MIITPTGNVKIVGLLIEAALRPTASDVVQGANTPELVDTTDLGRLLYASLVCRWPRWPGVRPTQCPVNGAALDDAAAGAGRSIAGAGQCVRSDSRRSAATSRIRHHHRRRHRDGVDQGARQR